MTRTFTRIAATAILAASAIGGVYAPANAAGTVSWTYSGRSADGGYTYTSATGFITYTSYKGESINFEFDASGDAVKVG